MSGSARGLTLTKLVPDSVQLGKTAVGKVGGDVAIESRGNSIARLAANAGGEADFGMGRGQVSKLLMEFAGLDLAGILKIKLTGDKQIPIRCAYADFAIRDGIMTPRAMVFDTSETRLNTEGSIDLRNGGAWPASPHRRRWWPPPTSDRARTRATAGRPRPPAEGQDAM